jgi:hypothetical protein
MSHSADSGTAHDVTEQVLATLDALRDRLTAARTRDDDDASREASAAPIQVLRDTHTDLLTLTTYLRAALDELGAREGSDASVAMEQDELDALAEEVDSLQSRVDALIDEIRERRSP